MQSRRSRRARGFTLVEAMVAMGLMALLLTGTTDLFLTATRTTARAGAQVSANMDGANALQHVTSDTREALWFALPDDPAVASSLAAFTPPPGDTVGQFETTYAGGTVDTGIQLTFPQTTTQTLCNASVGNTLSTTTYDRTQSVPDGSSANTLWIYRADAGGVPDAAAGAYLWAYGMEPGTATVVSYALCKSVDTNSDPEAVMFVRPTNGAAQPLVLPYQVEAKIISSYYSPIGGQQTSEAANGTSQTALSGKCVLMRDHDSGGPHDPGSSTTTSATSGSRWRGL